MSASIRDPRRQFDPLIDKLNDEITKTYDHMSEAGHFQLLSTLEALMAVLRNVDDRLKQIEAQQIRYN